MNLIDTGVWIDWINGRFNPATDILDHLLEEGSACLAPVILQEILQGARSETVYHDLRSQFSRLPMLSLNEDSFSHAALLNARCRWQGITIRSPNDCLIAALAVEHAAPLLTLDADFRHIARLEPELELLRSD